MNTINWKSLIQLKFAFWIIAKWKLKIEKKNLKMIDDRSVSVYVEQKLNGCKISMVKRDRSSPSTETKSVKFFLAKQKLHLMNSCSCECDFKWIDFSFISFSLIFVCMAARPALQKKILTDPRRSINGSKVLIFERFWFLRLSKRCFYCFCGFTTF